MKRYCLDTSVIIDFLRGKEPAVNLLASLDGTLVSSFICLSELYEGIFRSHDKDRHEASVLTFFASLETIYSLDEHVARTFGEVRAQLKGKGEIIEDIDLFIAATCLTYDCTLITHNYKHFSRIPNLLLYTS